MKNAGEEPPQADLALLGLSYKLIRDDWDLVPEGTEVLTLSNDKVNELVNYYISTFIDLIIDHWDVGEKETKEGKYFPEETLHHPGFYTRFVLMFKKTGENKAVCHKFTPTSSHHYLNVPFSQEVTKGLSFESTPGQTPLLPPGSDPGSQSDPSHTGLAG